MEPVEKCTKCGAALSKLSNGVCDRCGWDAQIGMRKCVKCKNAVVLNEKPGYGPMGGLAGLTGFIFWWFFGLLLGGTIASVVGAVCGLVTALTLSYACSDCGKTLEPRLQDAEEKETFKNRRLGFAIGAGGLGVLAAALFVGWILIVRSRFGGP